MDKLAAVTTSLFIAANSMSIISLLKPEWIVSKLSGRLIF